MCDVIKRKFTEKYSDVFIEWRHFVEHFSVDLLDLIVNLHHVGVRQPVQHLLVVELVAWESKICFIQQKIKRHKKIYKQNSGIVKPV